VVINVPIFRSCKDRIMRLCGVRFKLPVPLPGRAESLATGLPRPNSSRRKATATRVRYAHAPLQDDMGLRPECGTADKLPCPNCGALHAQPLVDLLVSERFDYYLCGRCGHLWTVTKDSGQIENLTPLRPPAGEDDRGDR
jgi:hypothetical protein